MKVDKGNFPGLKVIWLTIWLYNSLEFVWQFAVQPVGGRPSRRGHYGTV